MALTPIQKRIENMTGITRQKSGAPKRVSNNVHRVMRRKSRGGKGG